MITSETILYWDQLATWITTCRDTNPTPVAPLDWVKFPDNKFQIVQSLTPNWDFEKIPGVATPASLNASTTDGLVLIIPVDSDEEETVNRANSATMTIQMMVVFARYCNPDDNTRQRACMNTLQALKDACRRFRYNENGRLGNTWLRNVPEKDINGATIPWMTTRETNLFRAFFTAHFANQLPPVICS